eukprot:CAMPEP_0169077318 /NCGR_PEP_ID=MMETSP1015-20121227/8815_1 /TAXON_ID=342587 /ORGANISM="Karlodinium micrum, Strain CCMP2283" /LENGTH=2681 /DNA_ID=CAMNT_0009136835 /DNA_START=25 /DNA_END=8073 /DNA_ORIENTATION=-
MLAASTDASGKKGASGKVSPSTLQQGMIRKICIGTAADGENERQQFKSNYVSTTKYELWNIVPKNLLEQFQRAANFWFLTVSIFQMLPLELSPTSQYATILPLCGVLFVTFCKDAWEDQLRRRDDKRVNNQRCSVVEGTSRSPHTRQIRWKDVTVYIQLERDAPVPADMVLLSSSNEDGVAYVDTAQLDGETTLKPKFALEETMRLEHHNDLLQLEGHIDSEMPNELVQSFNGTLFLRGHPRGAPIDAKNFLLRGSTLRNTKWVFGVVVFTGFDTKLVQNSKPTPSKRSHVEVMANRLLLIVFGLLIMAATISAICRAVWLAGGGTGSLQMEWVWPESDKVQDNQYLAFITFMIGYNNLIPISLYVTTDLVRTFQGLLMERDPSMYHLPTDSGCRVRNSSLCENLGQVEFVLSDKTGTLTENKMSFKACSIGDRIYGCWDEGHGPVNHVVALPPSEVCVPLDKKLWAALKPARKPERIDSERLAVDDFFLCLATCHTAIVEALPPASLQSISGSRPGAPQFSDLQAGTSSLSPGTLAGRRNSNSTPASRRISRSLTPNASVVASDWQSPLPELLAEAQGITFRSSSPDEEALVGAARDHGYFFRKRVASRLVVNVRGEDQCYTLLVCNEFSSERKRMSVLVQRVASELSRDDLTANRPPAMLYVKGADNVMMERLEQRAGDTKKTAPHIKQQLKRFASCGLRTLILAKREVPASLADTFVQKMHDAKGALMYRERMMEEVADEMETNLQYLGITAIEDKIQQGVPKTISMLLRGGIKVWMLTGDNMETAVNIGTACSLTTSEMECYKLDVPSTPEEATPDAVEQKLESYYKDISRKLNRSKKEGPFSYCVVVHGTLLYTIEDHDRLRQLFLSIACSSNSVIACRLAPAQKAALVYRVRNSLEGNPLTLAIGDGGNDVSMIQEAHVGVGILGVEGRQAANASDFVISQFRFLQQLLLVHGRWNLRRIGIVIGYSFYKNFTLVLPMVYYALYTGFSGTTLYDSYLLTCYNLFFTSLPILVMGVFDRDVSYRMALLVPSLYQLGIQKTYFNKWMLIGWILRGGVHSIFIFWGVRALFYGSMASTGGNVPDYLVMGSWGYWACVAVVNVTMLLHTKAWMDWYVGVVIFSAAIFLPMLLLYSQSNYASMLNAEMVGVGNCLFGRLGSWLGLLAIISASGLSDFAVLFARKVFYPDAADILQEVQLGYLSGTNSSCFTEVAESTERTSSLDTIHSLLSGSDKKDEESDAGLDDSDDDADDAKPENLRIRSGRSSELEPEMPYTNYLNALPCPPPRLHQVKPIGNLYLEPLIPASARPAAVAQKVHMHETAKGMASVVPSLPSQNSSSSVFENSIKTFTHREQGFVGRMSAYFSALYERAYQQQWSKMTTSELLASLGRNEYNKMLESKHFKSADQGDGASAQTPTPLKAEGPFSQASSSATSSRNDADMVKMVSAQSEPSSLGQQRDGSFGPPGSEHTRVSGQSDNSGSESTRGKSLQNKPTEGYGSLSPRAIVTTGEMPSAPRDELPFTGNASLERKASVASVETHTTEVVRDLIYSVVTLRFLSDQQEASFRKYFSDHSLLVFQKFILVACATLLLYNLYGQIVYGSERPLLLRIGVVVMLLCGTAVVSYFLRTAFVVRNAETCISACILAGVVLKHCYDFMADSDGILGNSYLPVFLLAGARIRITGTWPVLLFHLMALLVHYWLLADQIEVNSDNSILSGDGRLQMEYYVLMIGITFLSFYYAYLIEKLMRQDFIVLFSLDRSKKQAMEILKNLFPEAVVNHVIKDIQRHQEARESNDLGTPTSRKSSDVKSIREDCGTVTVLFCDIQEFDQLVENLDPKDLVHMLDQVWQAFDHICHLQNLTKIETVGKTYMAAAMTEDGETQIANGVVHSVMMALDMLELVEKRVLGVGKSVTNVSVRIGIHTGQAMCGVVGSRKPQFALFGDTVNTASRMQSTGQKNHVHISSSTYKYVQNDPRFVWQSKTTFVKGKGDMSTYLLTSYNMKPRRRSTGGADERPTPVNTKPDESREKPLPLSLNTRMSITASASGSDSLAAAKSVSWGKRSSDVESGGSSPSGPRRRASTGDRGPPTPPKINVTAPASPREAPLPLHADDQEDESKYDSFGEDSPTPSEMPSKSSSAAPTRSNSSSFPRRLSGQISAGLTNLLGSSEKDKDKDALAVRDVNSTNTTEPPTTSMLVSKVTSTTTGNTSSVRSSFQSSVTASLSPRGVSDFLSSASVTKLRRKILWQVNGHVRDTTQRDVALYSQDIKSIWVSLQSFWVCYAAESFCLLLGRQGRDADNPEALLAVRGGFLAITLVFSFMLYRQGRRLKWGMKTTRWSAFFADFVSLLIFVGFISSMVSNVALLPEGNRSEFWNVFESFFFVMVLMHMYRLNLQGVVPVILCLLVIVASIATTAARADKVLTLECIVYSLLMSGTQMLAVQGDPRRSRDAHKAICEEHERVTELLDSMLPREVLSEMKLGTLNTAYSYADMTFLFADIVGFTTYCATHTAEEAVNLVTRLFAEFDESTVELQIYKVCTIGDAYVVVNEPRMKVSDKFGDCERVYHLAHKMIKIIIRVREQVKHPDLDMRIGLHCGSFVGGVIGTTRVRFDIWGQDVIIGNKIESEGKAGRICASDQAKQVLENCPIASKLTFTHHNSIELKTKRIVDIYDVGNNEDDSPLVS